MKQDARLKKLTKELNKLGLYPAISRLIVLDTIKTKKKKKEFTVKEIHSSINKKHSKEVVEHAIKTLKQKEVLRFVGYDNRSQEILKLNY